MYVDQHVWVYLVKLYFFASSNVTDVLLLPPLARASQLSSVMHVPPRVPPALSVASVSTASRCAVTMLFGMGRVIESYQLGPPLRGDSAPSWSDLETKVHATATGTRMLEAEAEWSRGAGPAHTDAKLRLFGQKEEDVRVVFYRDTAAWCPYCPVLTRASPSLRTVRTGYAYQPSGYRTYQRHRAACSCGTKQNRELSPQVLPESLAAA